MANSETVTSTSNTVGGEYQVFLSFRGPDTRLLFTNFLHEALVGAGIRVFIDDVGLQPGEKISNLLHVIDNCKLYIPIFSKDYASSHWCLDELAKMVKNTSKHKEDGKEKVILPIFYDVKPKDVKLQTPLYKDVISNLEQEIEDQEQKFSSENIKTWWESLVEVGGIKGWEVEKHSRKEDYSPAPMAQGVEGDAARPPRLNGLPSNPNLANNAKPNSFNRRQKIAQQRKSLPIASVEKRLIQEVRNNNTLIVVGETGSGKTTQIPQFLFNAGFCSDGKVIGVTQPRRVAAVTVAKRVAEESGVELGQRVGYSIRFDDMTSGSTRIKYMTDGLLLREALLDPYLSRYSVLIVDEAHERTVHTDVLLGLLKDVQNKRSASANDCPNTENKQLSNGMLLEKGQGVWSSTLKQGQNRRFSTLKLIIMSASLDARVFSEYFGGARAVHVQGRQFPVDILYTLHPQPDYLDATLITIFQIHLEEGPGDVLVFLTGQEEIESVERLIQERLRQLPEGNRNMLTVSIFSSLPSEKQMRVFAPSPPGFRKVILATNIAETSVTIPGIKYVVDPGFVKARSYDPAKGMESLIVIPTSKAQALQRSGRAGREGPGKCFRLYPESEFEKLEDSTKPEIKRCNLSNVVLQLMALGVKDVIGFDFIEKPPRAAIVKSLEQLFLLGALTEDCKLSDPLGHQMARLPLDPMYSKALIQASQFNCVEEVLITVAMLSVESIFYAPREKLEEARTAMKCFSSADGDHITLINVFRAADEFLEKRKSGQSKEKDNKLLKKWCKENFINSRSLRHARDIHRQIQGHVEQMGLHIASCGDDMVQFRRCLAASFFLNAALKQPEGLYRALASGQVVQIHPSSVLFRTKPECIIFNELVQTNHKYIRNITRIDYLWLTELAPQYYSMQR